MGGEGVDHLIDREAELLEPAGEPDPVDIGLPEGAVAARRTGCWAEDATTLVEADRVDGDTDDVGELADPQLALLGLTLDHGPEFTVIGMTTLLSITARPDAPIACDMSTATDSLAERLAEYRRLFEHALVGRESTPTTTTFRFAARPGVADWLRDLTTREAACCGYLSYEINQDVEEIVWVVSGDVGTSELALVGED